MRLSDNVITDLQSIYVQSEILQPTQKTLSANITYNAKHKTMNADLSFKIIDRQSITAKRKISEAFHIIKQDTKLNNRDEMVSLRNTLSRMFWTCLNFLCILCNIDLVFTFMCV